MNATVKKANLAKNTILAFISNLSNLFLFILLFVTGKFLGDIDFGKFTFALAFSSIFCIISDFGLSELAKKTIARNVNETKKLLGNIIVWKMLLSLIAFFCAIFSVNMLEKQADVVMVVAVISIATIIKSFKTTAISIFQANERFDFSSISQISHNILILVFPASVLFLGGGLQDFVIAFAIVKLTDLIIAYGILNYKIVELGPRLDFNYMVEFQKAAVPLGFFYFTIQIYSYVDTVMLSIIKSDAEVGWYNAAYKIYEGLMLFPAVLCQAISPELFRLHLDSHERHLWLSEKAIKYLAVLAFFMIGFGVVYSENLISLFFGDQFIHSHIALQILFCGIFVLYINWIFHTIMISIDRQNALMLIVVAGLSVNVLTNLAFMPKFGFVAAAASTVLCEFIVFLISYIYIKRFYRFLEVFKYAVKPFFTIVGLLLISHLLKIKPSFFNAFFMFIFYMIILCFLKTFSKDEIVELSRTVGIKKWQ